MTSSGNPSAPIRQQIGAYMVDLLQWAEEHRRELAIGSVLGVACGAALLVRLHGIPGYTRMTSNAQLVERLLLQEQHGKGHDYVCIRLPVLLSSATVQDGRLLVEAVHYPILLRWYNWYKGIPASALLGSVQSSDSIPKAVRPPASTGAAAAARDSIAAAAAGSNSAVAAAAGSEACVAAAGGHDAAVQDVHVGTAWEATGSWSSHQSSCSAMGTHTHNGLLCYVAGMQNVQPEVQQLLQQHIVQQAGRMSQLWVFAATQHLEQQQAEGSFVTLGSSSSSQNGGRNDGSTIPSNKDTPGAFEASDGSSSATSSSNSSGGSDTGSSTAGSAGGRQGLAEVNLQQLHSQSAVAAPFPTANPEALAGSQPVRCIGYAANGVPAASSEAQYQGLQTVVWSELWMAGLQQRQLTAAAQSVKARTAAAGHAGKDSTAATAVSQVGQQPGTAAAQTGQVGSQVLAYALGSGSRVCIWPPLFRGKRDVAELLLGFGLAKLIPQEECDWLHVRASRVCAYYRAAAGAERRGLGCYSNSLKSTRFASVKAKIQALLQACRT